MPETELSDNQVALSLALQFSVPPPVLLMVRACTAGLPPPCWAVKDRLVGLVPIAGLTESTGTGGGEFNSANLGISAAIFRIDRPPAPPSPDLEDLPAPAAVSGTVAVDAGPGELDAEAVADEGATLMAAKGIVVPTLLLSDDGSLG